MKRVLLKLITFIHKRKIEKLLECGSRCEFGLKGKQVSLHMGSTKDCIKLGDNVRLLGQLISSNGGQIIIGNNVSIGANTRIRASELIVIGDFCAISEGIVICDNNNHPTNPKDREYMQKTPIGSVERSWVYAEHAPIRIGNACWIGENSRICKGVTIGNGSIVAANSVVTKSVPDNCIVAGNPAKIVKTDIDKLPRYFKN